MSSLSVVIYGYNEENNFPSVVHEVSGILKGMIGQYELILVDDGSSDMTQSILDKFKQEDRYIKVITHPQRRGIGTCLNDGYQAATGELVTWLPADGQIDPKDILRFIKGIDDCDVVSSYYDRGSLPFFRNVMSRSVRILVFMLFGPSPRIEGSYMFRRKVLEEISLVSTSFAINFEFVIKAYRKGFRFKFFETHSRPRLSGGSKVINLDTIWKVFIEIIKLRMKFT